MEATYFAYRANTAVVHQFLFDEFQFHVKYIDLFGIIGDRNLVEYIQIQMLATIVVLAAIDCRTELIFVINIRIVFDRR